MDETKRTESSYSQEPTEVATLGSPQEETRDESRGAQQAAPSSQPKPRTGMPETRQKTPMAASPMATSGEYSSLADFLEFLKRTKRVWLSVAGVIFGVTILVTGVSGLFDWATKKRERRHEQEIAAVTPESLIARCGQPSEDTTKEVYPVLMRTMIYRRRGEATMVFDFSRTAEEKSDWVFLSMKDESGAQSYDTPEAKIAAMSCLDSRK